MTHEELIEICQEIGSVPESNGHYTAGLADQLKGRAADQLTVADLVHAIRVRNVRYNDIMRGV